MIDKHEEELFRRSITITYVPEHFCPPIVEVECRKGLWTHWGYTEPLVMEESMNKWKHHYYRGAYDDIEKEMKMEESKGSNVSACNCVDKCSNVFELIRKWSEERRIINAGMVGQMCKLTEEIGEIAHAVCRRKNDEIMDGIGDAIVVLTILAQQMGVKVETCIEKAYNEIANRKGIMRDGVFVKEDTNA